MSKVMDALRGSPDPLANDLAAVLEHWQDAKHSQGRPASLGYEPRDINLRGVVPLISSRVLSAAAGFEVVDPGQSYEFLVLKYPERFADNVVAAARQRLRLGASKLHEFRRQDIQFLVKTSAIDLFTEKGVGASRDNWVGRVANLPKLDEADNYANVALAKGFQGLVWFHEHEKDGEHGSGLTALATFGPMQADRTSQVRDAMFFDVSIGRDFLEAHRNDGTIAAAINKNRHSRLWPISDTDADLFLSAVRDKTHKIAEYESHCPDPQDALNLETIEETTALRRVVLRHYQAIFRQRLLGVRANRCTVTGTTELSVLEAAHIIPYSARFADRDRLENGLLLRSDIHKLFDAHLISINPTTKVVEVSSRVTSGDYLKLRGVKIADSVAAKSLEFHFDNFQE